MATFLGSHLSSIYIIKSKELGGTKILYTIAKNRATENSHIQKSNFVHVKHKTPKIRGFILDKFMRTLILYHKIKKLQNRLQKML